MTDLLRTHRAHLERFRHTMNLVGPGPLDEHFDDCAAALAWLEPSGSWADLGSGAGFPGIPFAARFPEIPLQLVDSRRKRCIFLEGVLAEAERADVSVACTRIEALSDGLFDGLLARALAAPEVVAAHARRLLRPGGSLVLMLNADQDHSLPGLQVAHVEPYTVAGKRRKSVGLRLQG